MFRAESAAPTAGLPELHLVFQNSRLVTNMRSAELCLLQADLTRGAGWQVRRRQFVGYWHDQPLFALEIDEHDDIDPLQFSAGSLYQLLGRVDEQLFAVAGRAAQLLDWERDHRFCGRCGSATVAAAAEHAMRCEACSITLYPRIAPCIITLVTRGDELLLARNANFSGPMYSTLAGFIEAGESAEETLVREVREEVGLEVGELRYFQSQNWPFPNQLMLGFFAEYVRGDITPDPGEIADAQWFHYSELPVIPPASTVAGQLIRHYVASRQP